MRVHKTNEDYMSDMVFSGAYGKQYMYTPEGMVARPGVAKNPKPGKTQARIPDGDIGKKPILKAEIPTAYAVSTVAKADLGYDTKPLTDPVKNAAAVAQSRLKAYIKKVKTGR